MPTKDLQWPFKGVVRKMGLRTPPNAQGPFPAPWAVNCRVEDNIDRRMRGGSRSGLTKYVSTAFGVAITDIVSIDVSRTTGTSAILVALVGSTIRTIENGIVSSMGSASGFLVTGQQYVYAVSTSGITRIDPKTTNSAAALAATEGSIPTDCTFGAVYRDRICLSGDDNTIYMSRQGTYTDWDYGKHVGDEGRAVAFQLSLGADVGPLPTAMIPNRDTSLICASARTLWVVNGDPTTGQLQRISEKIGIVSSKAWCRVDDSIVFLSADGLYRMGADGSNLTPLSPEAVPAELLDIDTSTTTVSIGYEQDREAFHIYLRTSAGSDTHWLYEIGAEAFWPMRLQNNHSPRAVCRHAGELILAGNDGYIRYVGGDNDDGTAIQSHVAIGPVRLGQPGYFGRLLHLHGQLAAGGGTVNWRIITGDTAEECADNAKLAIEAFQSGSSYSTYVSASGNWISGRAIIQYPRVRGVWACLWLQSTNKWAFEAATIRTELSGTWRGSSSGVVTEGNVSPSSSPSASATPSSSPSASVSSSPSTSPSASVSSSPSQTPSVSVSSSPSASFSSSPSATTSSSPSSSKSSSPSTSRSSSPSASPSSSRSSTPSASLSSSPSASASSSPSTSPSPSSSPSSSRSSSPSQSSSPSESRSSSPSVSSTPSASRSSSASSTPSSSPSTSPSTSVSSSPSTSASSSPSASASSSPSTSPSAT